MDELIRRREAIAALGERPLVWVGSDYELGARNQYDCDRLAVETTPTVDAVPVVHGHWIRVGVPDIDGNQQYRCSVCECGEIHAPSVKVSYCWNCGARMDEKDGDHHE